MLPFFLFPVRFRSSSSRSTGDLLTFIPDTVARASNRSDRFRATRVEALDIFKVFGRVRNAVFLRKLKSCGILGEVFDRISSFLSNRWIGVFLDGMSLQEYPDRVNAGVPQSSIFGPIPFTLYSKEFRGDVIYNITIYDDDTTLNSKFDQASNLSQQLEVAAELECDL